jgi:hypothetical protein
MDVEGTIPTFVHGAASQQLNFDVAAKTPSDEKPSTGIYE